MSEDDAKSVGLSTKQQAVILALVEERTVAAAARKANVARSSIYIWMKDEAFRHEVARVRDFHFVSALDLVNASMERAVEKLVEGLEHGSATLRLKAAAELCKLAMEIREKSEIEAKVRELEERARRLKLPPDEAKFDFSVHDKDAEEEEKP